MAYRVPSLEVHDPDNIANPQELTQSEAVRLFQERASAIAPSFRLTEETTPIVSRICHRLDGIPLAIELAAARVNVMDAGQIFARLDDRFRLLTGGSRTALPRQRTLRASIDWSYSLLSQEECTLLQRLSVFSGDWTLEAAETVCAFGGMERWDVLECLASLVKKSMIVVYSQPGSPTRYRMLETIRQYAQEKLGEGQHGAIVSDRHLAFFVSMAQTDGPLLDTGQIEATLNRLDLELDNLRAALTWALGKRNQQGAEAALDILSPLRLYWSIRLLYWEMIPLFRQALSRIPDEAANSPAWRQSTERKARALFALSTYTGDFFFEEEAVGWLNQCITMYRKLGDLPGLAEALVRRKFQVCVHNAFFPTHTLISEAQAILDGEEASAIAHQLADDPRREIQNVIATVDCYNGGGEVLRSNLLEGAERGYQSRKKFLELGNTIGAILGLLVWTVGKIQLGATMELLPEVDEAIELVKRINDKGLLASLYDQKQEIYHRSGRYKEMQEYVWEERILHRQMGGIVSEIKTTRELAVSSILQHNDTEARTFLQEALHLSIDVMKHKDVYGLLEILFACATLAIQNLDEALAATLLGHIEPYAELFGTKLGAIPPQEFAEYQAAAGEALGEVLCLELWQQGQAMTLEQAAALGLAYVEQT